MLRHQNKKLTVTWQSGKPGLIPTTLNPLSRCLLNISPKHNNCVSPCHCLSCKFHGHPCLGIRIRWTKGIAGKTSTESIWLIFDSLVELLAVIKREGLLCHLLSACDMDKSIEHINKQYSVLIFLTYWSFNVHKIASSMFSSGQWGMSIWPFKRQISCFPLTALTSHLGYIKVSDINIPPSLPLCHTFSSDSMTEPWFPYMPLKEWRLLLCGVELRPSQPQSSPAIQPGNIIPAFPQWLAGSVSAHS